MHRRDVLRATAAGIGVGLGSGAGTGRFTGHAAAHPGPYRPLGSVSLRGAKEAVVADDGETVYLALSDGFGVVDVSDPEDPSVVLETRDLLAEREYGPLEQIYDVKTDGDRLLVVGPAHRPSNPDEALMGALVYDVSEPTSPEFVDFHETDYPIHNCEVADGIGYLTGNLGDGTAMVMLDVSGDSAAEVGRWHVADENDAWSDVHPFIRSIHDITVHGDVAYVAHWDAGTWLVDVSDPTDAAAITAIDTGNPQDLVDVDLRETGYQLPGNSHYCAVNDDATVLGVGEEAWDLDTEDDLNGGPGGITLYDISNHDDVTELARIEAPPTPESGIGGVWTTSHNFDFHGDRLYTSWYRGGVKIFDVTDPSDPTELAWWRQPDEASFWTAQYAPGPGCFIASSRRNPPAEDPKGAALYTFPDHEGVQEDPPSLTTTSANNSSGTTNTTEPKTTTTTPTTTTTTTTSGADAPGFGLVTGAAALGTATLAWLTRREREE